MSENASGGERPRHRAPRPTDEDRRRRVADRLAATPLPSGPDTPDNPWTEDQRAASDLEHIQADLDTSLREIEAQRKLLEGDNIAALGKRGFFLRVERCQSRSHADIDPSSLDGDFWSTSYEDATATDHHWIEGAALFVGGIDLDNFKVWNTFLGHQGGDAILRGVGAARLGAAGFIGRLGGDEFGIALRARDLEHAYRLLDKVKDVIRDAVIDSLEREIVKAREHHIFSEAKEIIPARLQDANLKFLAVTNAEHSAHHAATLLADEHFGFSVGVRQIGRDELATQGYAQADRASVVAKFLHLLNDVRKRLEFDRNQGEEWSAQLDARIDSEVHAVTSASASRERGLTMRFLGLVPSQLVLSTQQRRTAVVAEYLDVTRHAVADALVQQPPNYLVELIGREAFATYSTSAGFRADIVALAEERGRWGISSDAYVIPNDVRSKMMKTRNGPDRVASIEDIAVTIRQRSDWGDYLDSERSKVDRKGRTPPSVRADMADIMSRRELRREILFGGPESVPNLTQTIYRSH